MESQYEEKTEGTELSAEDHREEAAEGTDSENSRPRRFGRGIYDKKDVPIRLLDGLIAGIIVILVVLIVVFALNGGYMISYDSRGGTDVVSEKLRYGQLVSQPEEPLRQGYEFAGWYYEGDTENNWNFSVNKVGGDMTLIARWEPAEITVRLDAGGGELPEGADSLQAVYQEKYGELPVPEKEGYVFGGWVYSGEKITGESTVTMPGEHVLTAVWEPES